MKPEWSNEASGVYPYPNKKFYINQIGDHTDHEDDDKIDWFKQISEYLDAHYKIRNEVVIGGFVIKISNEKLKNKTSSGMQFKVLLDQCNTFVQECHREGLVGLKVNPPDFYHPNANNTFVTIVVSGPINSEMIFCSSDRAKANWKRIEQWKKSCSSRKRMTKTWKRMNKVNLRTDHVMKHHRKPLKVGFVEECKRLHNVFARNMNQYIVPESRLARGTIADHITRYYYGDDHAQTSNDSEIIPEIDYDAESI